MTTDTRAIAEAFSGHRFAAAYDPLAPDLVWVLVGASTIRGKDAAVEACEGTLAALETTATEFTRFVSVADADVAVVDVTARYADADGSTSVVSSCDVYEFADDLVVRITSYTVELEAS